MELFTPAAVPKLTGPQAAAPVRAAQLGRPLPWEVERRTPRGRVWQHTVYAGVFEVKRYRAALRDVFRETGEPVVDGRDPSGHSALLCFTVNDDGRLIKDSVMLCSCAWALSRALDPGPHTSGWLDGFETDARLLLGKVLQVGDARLPVVRLSHGPKGQATQADGGQRWLGTVAGMAADVVLGVAQSEVGVLASAAGAGVGGGLVGSIAAKTVGVLGDRLIAAARDGLSSGGSGAGDGPSTAPPGDHADPAPGRDERPGTDEQPGTEGEVLGTKVLDLQDLVAVTRWVIDELDVGEELVPDAIRIKSVQVPERSGDEAGKEELLNSFYADDLTRIADAADRGRLGAALTRYLTPDQDLDTVARVDVRRSPRAVYENVVPDRAPLGAWPVRPSQPMALSQQFAVNNIMADLGRPNASGIHAVNGPPGTGKTYLLRDLIAAVVVQRAEVLARLARPAQCLDTKPVRWQAEGTNGQSQQRQIRPPIAGLTGFEMIVASSNNGAVENVSLTTPALDALGEEWQDVARYLHRPAGRLLDADAWGAVAAKLGRRSYRGDFVENFWWGRLKPGESVPAPETLSGPARDRSGHGLHDLLFKQNAWIKDTRSRSQNDTPEAQASAADTGGGGEATEPPLGADTWSDAVARFTQARADVVRLIGERRQLAGWLARTTGADAVLEQLSARSRTDDEYRALLTTRVEQAETALAAAAQGCASAGVLAEAAQARVEEWRAAGHTAVTQVWATARGLDAHDQAHHRPRRVVRFLSRKADQRWDAARQPHMDAVSAARRRWSDCDRGRAAAESELHRSQQAVTRQEAERRERERALDESRLTIVRAEQRRRETEILIGQRRKELDRDRHAAERYRATWGDRFPRPEDWNAAPTDQAAMERRELSAPWMDEDLLTARSRLFVAALDLHRAVLANEPDLMRKNLLVAMEVVKGTAGPDLPEAAILAAWQLLFLVVPVISTTFASLDRMLAGLGPESLGWVFIDEAGQATPQQAVGALWRTRRAVVVGDPMQIEPVNTLPWSAQVSLCAHFGVDDQWTPGGKSVQTVADRLARHGTWLTTGGDPVWVGSPLRVHRRCGRLMFEVSNTIAYDGMMVYGKTGGDGADYDLVISDIWTHVPARPGREKWNDAEGLRAAQLLTRISERLADQVRRERAERAGMLGGPLLGFGDDDETNREVRRRVTSGVFVISPFVEVAFELRRVLASYFEPKGVRERIGTVHVTQGKEADIVVFVLGTGADARGTRDWASSPPNLLNVAVTRAKKRLVVIGDIDRWAEHRGFDVLSRHEALTQWRPQ